MFTQIHIEPHNLHNNIYSCPSKTKYLVSTGILKLLPYYPIELEWAYYIQGFPYHQNPTCLAFGTWLDHTGLSQNKSRLGRKDFSHLIQYLATNHVVNWHTKKTLLEEEL